MLRNQICHNVQDRSFNSRGTDTSYGYRHYSDVIMSAMGLISPAYRLFAQPFVQVQIKENIIVPFCDDR